MAVVLLGMWLCGGTPGTAQSIKYELVEGSNLGLTSIDPEGNLRRIVFAELRGTFTMIFGQLENAVEGYLRDIVFQSITGPDYRIVGDEGFYGIGIDPNSPTGLPSRGGIFMTIQINENWTSLIDQEYFRTFPRIEAELVRQDILGGESLRITARPIPEDAARFFRRGDVNGDIAKNLTDAVAILAVLFEGAGPLDCPEAADANDDGKIDLTDCVTILTSLFAGGGDLPLPARLCGTDITDDPLGCSGQPVCLSE